MAITRQSIGRGGIRSAGYDRASRLLEIEFEGGRIVQHTGVGDEIARRFLSSGSPASYYRDNIEEEFPQKRL
ncbi:KTSC domain-containing protein [Viridibacterium curvum]|uniref:KTSC domain-containing protein n=1 Tax=Viridibacterium curvum TaxID=1101404 RepID=A0ABP9R364_9RHOO